MTAKTILNPPGIQSFRRFLTNELPSLKQAPILLIASEPAAAADAVSHSTIRDASRLVHFTLSQQFGLRIVPANISSGFPTLSDVQSRRDLLRRTGASSIVAVGSGAAMDLAKALASNDNQQKHHDMEHLILLPSTYSAFIASGSSHSLLLDQVEETLLPYPSMDKNTTNVSNHNSTVTVAPLERNYMATMDSSHHALYAVTAIVLDTYLRKIDNPQLDSMIDSLQMLYGLSEQDFHGQLAQDTLLDLCFRAGTLISYGLGRDDRSTPLALSSSLIPPLFPHIPMLTFWASLVPGLCHVLSSTQTLGSNGRPAWVQEIISQCTNNDLTNSSFPKLTLTDESKKGFSIPDMAISHIQANATVAKSFDMPQQVLTEILKHAIPK